MFLPHGQFHKRFCSNLKQTINEHMTKHPWLSSDPDCVSWVIRSWLWKNQYSNLHLNLILPPVVLKSKLLALLPSVVPASHSRSYWMKYLFTQLWLVFTDILQVNTVQRYVRFHTPIMNWKATVSVQQGAQIQGQIGGTGPRGDPEQLLASAATQHIYINAQLLYNSVQCNQA